MSDNDFEFSEVQLEFQSQPDEESDNETEETSQSQTNKTEYHTESQTPSQSQDEALLPRLDDEANTQEDSSEVTDAESELATEDNTDGELAFQENFDLYDLSSLPEHACCYCGIHSPDSVVKCTDCQKWFCNNKGSTTGAHIINHLVKSGHKKVSLHKDSPLGQAVLECFNCGGKNVFLLGFIPAKSESIVVLICREPCLTLNSLKEMNWDLSQWVPLIKERMFLSWLVKIPSEKEINQSIKISAAQIMKLEEQWKEGNESATVQDLDRQELNDDVEPVMVHYENASVYRKIYAPLIKMESENDKKKKEAQRQTGVKVRWDIGLNNRQIFYFRLHRNIEVDVRIVPGDELKLSYPGDLVNKPWSSGGVVIKTTINDEVMAEIWGRKEDTPVHQFHGFNIDFVWKPVPYDRMLHSLERFEKDDYSISTYLFHLLMGREVTPQRIVVEELSDYSAPGLPKLNKSQMAAVKNSLSQPMSLIQGPPGTGKTVTTASLVYHLAQHRQEKILVCAPSNIGVDQLTAKIHATGLKVIRIPSKSRELVASFVEFLYLNTLVTQLSRETNSHLYKLEMLKDMQGELSIRDKKRYDQLKRKSELDLLETADVICTTCVGAMDGRLKSFRFRTVVIDESTQATEPEAMIPITKGAKQICLIGDHCQLGPVIISKKAAKAGLQRSLFERLIMLGIRPMRLQVQYRMHPCLSEFPSNTFYEGSLQNGVSIEERKQKPGISFEWPDANAPMFFYCSTGTEEYSASGTSYLNRVEAVNMEKIVTELLRSGITPEQIGVITPYEGQRQYIINTMLRTGSLKKRWYEELEVANVDAFQGREKDYIILSCVRSNENLGIGFLGDPRRLNVAITRAKFGLILVGNPKVLSTQPLWHSLLTHFKKHRLLVEGPLDNLNESFIRLSEPKDYYERRRIYACNEDDEDKQYETIDCYQNKGFAGNDEETIEEEIPTQYIYAHPGEIGPTSISNPANFSTSRSFRPPVINRKQRGQGGKDAGLSLLSGVTDYNSQSQPFTQHYNSFSVASQEASQATQPERTPMMEDYSFDAVIESSKSLASPKASGVERSLHGRESFDSQKKAASSRFEGLSEMSQGENFAQFGGTGFENDHFTQHLQSQTSGFLTQPESQIENDLDDLSLGGLSQELNGLSQTESDETDEDR